MEEAKQLLKHQALWSLSFAHREANAAAHFLAKLSLNLNEKTVWIEKYPSVHSDVVLVDICNQ